MYGIMKDEADFNLNAEVMGAAAAPVQYGVTLSLF
jgi:hypothetical protein